MTRDHMQEHSEATKEMTEVERRLAWVAAVLQSKGLGGREER